MGRVGELTARVRSGTHVRRILAGEAFQTVAQPIVELTTKRRVGFECLARFDGADTEATFRAAAGSTSHLHELELAAIVRAVETTADLPLDAWISFNVSPSLLIEHAPRLWNTLARVEQAIVLEVSEHERIEDYAALRQVFAHAPIDVRIAVDDAGSRFAGLTHLVDLGADFIKLDRRWIAGIEAHLEQRALVGGLQHFASETGAQLVAEGIETAAQLDVLMQLGIPLGQGHLLGRPADPVETATIVLQER